MSFRMITRMMQTHVKKVVLKMLLLGLASSNLVGIVRADEKYGLDELINIALSGYPTILARMSDRDAADSDVLAAKLGFLPAPSVSTQRNTVQYDGGQASRLPATTATVSQPLLGGGIVSRYQKTTAKLQASEYALLEARQDVAFKVVSAYAGWLRAHKKIDALKFSVKRHEFYYDMIQRRSLAGVASMADRDLAMSRLDQARADLQTQISAMNSAIASLEQLVAMPVSDGTLKFSSPAALPERKTVLAQSLDQSVVLARHRYEAEAAEAEAGEIRAQALPQLSFQASRQIGNPYVPGLQSYNSYGLVVQYTPGSGLGSVATASGAYKRAESVKIQTEAAKRELLDTLNTELNEYESSKTKTPVLAQSAKLSDDLMDSYTRQYIAGRKSWLDLMNAVREQVQSRIQYIDADVTILATSRRLSIYSQGGM